MVIEKEIDNKLNFIDNVNWELNFKVDNNILPNINLLDLLCCQIKLSNKINNGDIVFTIFELNDFRVRKLLRYIQLKTPYISLKVTRRNDDNSSFIFLHYKNLKLIDFIERLQSKERKFGEYKVIFNYEILIEEYV